VWSACQAIQQEEQKAYCFGDGSDSECTSKHTLTALENFSACPAFQQEWKKAYSGKGC